MQAILYVGVSLLMPVWLLLNAAKTRRDKSMHYRQQSYGMDTFFL
jgi:hypothetical protein